MELFIQVLVSLLFILQKDYLFTQCQAAYKTTYPFIRSLVPIIKAGEEECYYEKFVEGDLVEISYQVLSTSTTDQNDISFEVSSPSMVSVASDERMTENEYKFDVKESGFHEICFDNTYSLFTEKIVFFEIYADKPEGFHEKREMDSEPDSTVLEMKYDDFLDSVDMIEKRLVKAKHLQDMYRATETRDLHLAQMKISRVTNWTALQIVVMCLVSFIQVVLVKSLIDERSKLHVVWKYIFNRWNH